MQGTHQVDPDQLFVGVVVNVDPVGVVGHPGVVNEGVDLVTEVLNGFIDQVLA